MRSPSTNPKSLFDSPPHEYVARHQQGNRVGRLGAAWAIIDAVQLELFEDVGNAEYVRMSCDEISPDEVGVVKESNSSGL